MSDRVFSFFSFIFANENLALCRCNVFLIIGNWATLSFTKLNSGNKFICVHCYCHVILINIIIYYSIYNKIYKVRPKKRRKPYLRYLWFDLNKIKSGINRFLGFVSLRGLLRKKKQNVS
jgi:hypothetical protein